MAKCPICNAAVKPRPENPSVPFCSARCKTIDLGKWLSEEYRVPVEPIRGASGRELGLEGSPEAEDDSAAPKTGADDETAVRH